jgi:CBS domain-containing protein
MSRRILSLDQGMEIVEATHLLVENDISGAPVLDDHGRLVGILTERDCMKVALHSGYYDSPYGLVRDYMTPNPEFVTPEQSVLTLADRFISGTFRRYPVVDNGRLVGIISRRDVLRAIDHRYGGKGS